MILHLFMVTEINFYASKSVECWDLIRLLILSFCFILFYLSIFFLSFFASFCFFCDFPHLSVEVNFCRCKEIPVKAILALMLVQHAMNDSDYDLHFEQIFESFNVKLDKSRMQICEYLKKSLGSYDTGYITNASY